MNIFRVLTPVLYLFLIGFWAYILFFFTRRIWPKPKQRQLISTLILILTIDAFRTLSESMFFGMSHTSLAGFLPISIHSFLIQPEMVFIPKVLNLVAAIAIIAILIFRWIPQEERETEDLNQQIKNRTLDLTKGNERLQKEISRHKQAQENLKLIFNNTPNILVLVKDDGRVEMINHKGSVLLNKEQDEVIGLLGGEVFNCLNSYEGEGCGCNPECSNCPVRTKVMSTFERGRSRIEEPGQMTFLVQGSELTIDLLISTSKLEVDGCQKVLLSLTDISTQKQAERELQFQSMLLGHIQDHITATDTQGKIVYVNEAVLKNLQYKRENLIGQSISIYGDNPSKGITSLQIIEKTMELGEWHGEKVSYASNGSERVMDCRSRLLRNEDATPSGTVRISTDITERKKLEERIQQAQKMEAIGNLAGGIAHDFNNLLSPIIGYSQMLRDEFPSGSQASKNLSQIFLAGQRGSELVKQILAFSRQTDHQMTPVRVQNVVKEAFKLTRSTIPTNIEMELKVQTDCGVVQADPTQVHQIAMNLITNAFHAISYPPNSRNNSGIISIQVKEQILHKGTSQIGSLDPGKYIVLTVSDNGMGIPPNIQAKIFDPYFTTKEKGNGTGLGLAVVYGIIKEFKGRITVQSEPGQGATFSVFLPLMPQYESPNSALDPEKITGVGTERLLLVDDEEAIVQLNKQTLERLGYHVQTRTSSVDALEAFRANPNVYDLVVTDLSMPHMTGVQLAQELLAISPGLPIILCTGFSEKLSEEDVKKIGIKALVMKPVVRSDFSRVIRAVLDDAQSTESTEG